MQTLGKQLAPTLNCGFGLLEKEGAKIDMQLFHSHNVAAGACLATSPCTKCNTTRQPAIQNQAPLRQAGFSLHCKQQLYNTNGPLASQYRSSSCKQATPSTHRLLPQPCAVAC